VEGPGRRASVLLVDDDAMVRQVMAEGLEAAGFRVVAAEGGEEALVLLEGGERLDALVSDLSMPGMSGLTVIREVQRRRPGVPAVLLTGHAGDAAAIAVGGAVSGSFSLMRKPVTVEALAERVAVLLEGAAVTGGG
jgi:CheY-like chemotaxis protein